MSTGIENAFIKEWTGWDNNIDLLQFYQCVLTSDVAEDLGIKTAELVELDMSKSIVTFCDGWDESVQWTAKDGILMSGRYAFQRTFKLRLSLAEEIKN